MKLMPKYLILLLVLFATQVNSVDVDKLKSVAKEKLKNEAVGIATSYLEKYFDVFELKY